MNYLTDTQIFIWATINPQKLSLDTQSLLQQNAVWVSQISLFEIAINQKIGKLPELSLTIDELADQLQQDGFYLLSLKTAHIAAYNALPLLANHRDPFDRLLMASAVAEQMTIISADEQFRQYVPQIQLVDA